MTQVFQPETKIKLQTQPGFGYKAKRVEFGGGAALIWGSITTAKHPIALLLGSIAQQSTRPPCFWVELCGD